MIIPENIKNIPRPDNTVIVVNSGKYYVVLQRTIDIDGVAKKENYAIIGEIVDGEYAEFTKPIYGNIESDEDAKEDDTSETIIDGDPNKIINNETSNQKHYSETDAPKTVDLKRDKFLILISTEKIPIEIRSIEIPHNTIIRKYANRYFIIRQIVVTIDGAEQIKNYSIIGELENGHYKQYDEEILFNDNQKIHEVKNYKYCVKCGAKIDKNAVYCPQCGCPTNNSINNNVNNNNNYSNNETKTKKSSKAWVGFLLCFFLNIIGLLVGLIIFPAKSYDRQTFLKGWGITFVVVVVLNIIIAFFI